jgi:hypothetical protein
MALGKRQEARGKRQEARGKSEEGLGDFTFRYILLFEKPLRVYGFFPFTYLDYKEISAMNGDTASTNA